MKRLAILLFCSVAYADTPIECKDDLCTVPKAKLQAMLESRNLSEAKAAHAEEMAEVWEARARWLKNGCQVLNTSL